MTGPRFQRANFLVSNLERALAFYRDILGFEVAFIKDSAPDSYSYEVFDIPPARTLRFAVLSCTGQPRVMALTEVSGDLPAAPLPRRSAIVVETPDLDRVLDEAAAAGLDVRREERLHTQDGRVGREVGIVDADGNLVVIYCITGHPERAG